MNIVHIAGHLGADPEVRFTSSGQKVTTLRLAAKARRSGKDETIWWRVTIWGEQYDKMIPYLKKGSSIIVVGELSKPEIFTDREGKPQISMGVTAFQIMFSPFGRGDRQQDSQSTDQVVASAAYEGVMSGQKPVDENKTSSNQNFNMDDEIPF